MDFTYRSLSEGMARDNSVLLFGEDIAEYGGAFGVTYEKNIKILIIIKKSGRIYF